MPGRRHLRYLGLMWLLLAVYFWPVVLAGGSLVPYDSLYSWEPWRSERGAIIAEYDLGEPRNPRSNDALISSLPLIKIAQRQLRDGMLPLWDHNTLTGFPVGAFFTLYPPQVLAAALLPPDRALNLLLVLHVFLLSGSAYLLVVLLEGRPLAGLLTGLVATVNGAVVYRYISPGILPALAWALAPFVGLALFQRRRWWGWSVVAGLAYGMLVLYGNLQMVLYVSLLYGVYLLLPLVTALWQGMRSEALRLVSHSAMMVLVGVLIGMPTLLFNVQLISEVTRPPAIETFIPPHWWLWVLAPGFWGDVLTPVNIAPGVEITMRIFIGVIPLGLVVIGMVYGRPEARMLAAIAIALIAVMLRVPLLTQLFYLFMPSAFLDHSRVLLLVALLLACVAGFGLDTLFVEPRARRLGGWVYGVLALLLSGLLMGSALLGTGPGGPDTAYRVASVGVGLVATLYGLGAALVWRHGMQRLAAATLITVSIIELFSAFWRYQSTTPHDLMLATPLIERLAARVHETVPPARVMFVSAGTPGPLPQLLNYFDIPEVAGYSSLPFTRYNRYTFASGARINNPQLYYGLGSSLLMEIDQPVVPAFNALGAEYILLPRDALPDGDYLVAFAPEIQRAPLELRQGVVQTLVGNKAAPLIKQTVSVPAGARSLLLTGAALIEGSLTVEAWVDGTLLERMELTGRPGQPAFWRPLTLNLTGFSGRKVTVELRSKAEAGTGWYWVDPQLLVNPDGGSLLLTDAGGLLLYQNVQAFPRAWLAHETVTVPPGDLDAAEAALAAPGLDLRRTAVVEAAEPLALGAASEQDAATITRYDPTRVAVEVTAGEPALLVVPDVYTSLWQARLDGTETTVYATNLAMRGVLVPAGAHTIEFYLNIRPFILALGVALITGLICVGWLVTKAWRRQL